MFNMRVYILRSQTVRLTRKPLTDDALLEMMQLALMSDSSCLILRGNET